MDYYHDDCASYDFTSSKSSMHNERIKQTFVDLFCGLGGFHVGLSNLGMKCVFASELDPDLRNLYQRNFGLSPEGDIRSIDESDIPPHDILCAGFPCQPFSAAGKKKGAACPESGKLIDDVLRIIAFHSPKFVLLENVPQILTIQNGQFWRYIQSSLVRLGYTVDHHIYSPVEFGIPQKRDRVFVVASKIGLHHFEWPTNEGVIPVKLNELIRDENEDIRPLEPQKMLALTKWQEFLLKIRPENSHTIIATEFGADYPIDNIKKLSLEAIRKHKGAFGQSLNRCQDWQQVLATVPHYVRDKDGTPPNWLIKSILNSRKIYQENKQFLDKWKLDLIRMNNSWQKLEWRGVRGNDDLWHHTIQFRASGIRVSKPDHAPSLVAMTPTQTPIIGHKKRYLAVREAAALQSLERLKYFPEKNARAFKALGNAVNAHIVEQIANKLIY